MSHRTQSHLALALAFIAVGGNALAEEKFTPLFASRSNTAPGQEASTESYKLDRVAAAEAGAPADQNFAYAMMIVNNIAGIYLAQGKYYQAELLYEKWL